jgi:hypothetical protein
MEDKTPVSTKPRISSASPPDGVRSSPLLGCSEEFVVSAGVDLQEKTINANSKKTIFNGRISKITFNYRYFHHFTSFLHCGLNPQF